jgi:hypothetical protein
MIGNAFPPYNREEAIEVHWAAIEAARSDRAIRNWCDQFGISRRHLAGGRWMISRVALAMLMDGNSVVLDAYLGGQRQGERVASYYHRCGLGHLLDLPEFKSR